MSNTSTAVSNLGVAIAVVLSYVKWHSIGWAILHGIFGWFYVVYFWAKGL
jgi:cell division septal protein FtsQ